MSCEWAAAGTGSSDCTAAPLWGAPCRWPAHLAPLAPFLDDPVPASFPGLGADCSGGGPADALLVRFLLLRLGFQG